jgi:hypothetical protein
MPACGGRSANSWPQQHEEIDHYSILPSCSPEMCPRVSLGYTKTKGIPCPYGSLDPEVAANSKKTKAPLRLPAKSRLGPKTRRFGLVSAGSVRPSRERRRSWDRRTGSRWSRVWVRSILLRAELVKDKCVGYHKIFGCTCPLCLHVVVHMQRGTSAIFARNCDAAAYDIFLVEIDWTVCAKKKTSRGCFVPHRASRLRVVRSNSQGIDIPQFRAKNIGL